MDEELKQAIEQAKEQQPVEISLEWYVNLQLKDVKTFIRANINSASRSFVAIGYYLKYIRDHELFTEDGYQNIWEFAQDEFGISKSSASRFMAINDRFSKNGNSPILLDQYKDFSSSKLSEMLTMTDDQLEQVSIASTRAEIREIKKADKVVAPAQQKLEKEKPSVFLKVCKYDGKSNCVAVCDTRAECCAECSDHGSCNTECGWQDERIPKPDIGCIDIPEDDPDPVETVEADIIQPDKEYDFDEIAAYDLLDVKTAINGHADNLVQYKDVELDAPVVKREKMEYDALKLLEEDMCMPELKEPPKPVQPELPTLKNNDQRKEWIDNYITWPIWIDLKETGERYYRYDFDNGISFVIRVSLHHKFIGWDKGGYSKTETEYSREEYFILEGSGREGEAENKTFREGIANKSAMVEFLKELQKN